jgi:hypothetical protein
MTEGMQEAFFDYYKNKSRRSPRFNIKKIFNIHRFLVLLSTGLILIYITQYYGILLMLTQIPMFKYFHKISYNIITKKLIEEPRVIIEESTISKAKEPLLIGVTIQLFIYLFLM